MTNSVGQIFGETERHTVSRTVCSKKRQSHMHAANMDRSTTREQRRSLQSTKDLGCTSVALPAFGTAFRLSGMLRNVVPFLLAALNSILETRFSIESRSYYCIEPAQLLFDSVVVVTWFEVVSV